MAAQDATMTGCSLLHGNSRGDGNLKTYLCTFTVPAYTTSADTITMTSVGANIASHVKNGKTNTLKGAICVEPGFDTNAQEVYLTGTSVWAMTVSSDTLTGHLAVEAGTEVASDATASAGIMLAITVLES